MTQFSSLATCRKYCAILALVTVATAGCADKNATQASNSSKKTLPGPAAKDIVAKMQATYAAADSLSVNAETVQEYVVRGEGVERELPHESIAIAYKRPNLLRFSYETISPLVPEPMSFELVSNGTVLRAAASLFPNQIYETVAPLRLTAGNLAPEPQLREALADNLPGGEMHPPLAMLLSSKREVSEPATENAPPLFEGDSKPYRLGLEELNDRECYRVAYDTAAGKRVLWIDTETYYLHRMELPSESINDPLATRYDLTQSSFWIDYLNQVLDVPIKRNAFEREVPEGTRLVSQFLLPPPPGPPEFLGEEVDDFEFVTLDGKKVTRDDLKGKPALLDIWFTSCPPCKQQTPVLEKAYQQLKDEGVAMYAVSTDRPEVSNEKVESTLRNWGTEMPVLRDTTDSAYKNLKVRVTPTTLLLDKEGRLQYIRIGLHRTADELVSVVKATLDGDNLAEKERDAYQVTLNDYQKRLESVTIDKKLVDVEVMRAEIAKRKLPEELVLTELWSSKKEDLERPGNLSVVDFSNSGGDQQGHVLVLDGGQEVVEFGLDGEVVARHELPDNTEQAGGFLRTTVDAQQRRWTLVGGVGWQKTHLFNNQWEHVLAFPTQRHPGIGDAILTSQAEDDQPTLLVGYWGGLGVQAADIRGKRLWTERSLEQVVQIAELPETGHNHAHYWCTSDRGNILPLDLDGKRGEPVQVAEHSLMYVALHPDHAAEADPPMCGLVVDDLNKYRVIGFTAKGEELWTYDLPPGEYAQQVSRIQPVSLPGGKPGWLAAAADGSMHWLTLEGQLVDTFSYGEELTGLAMAGGRTQGDVTNDGDSAILLVSCSKSLTAWKVQSAAQINAKQEKEGAEKE
ncbi:redoxin domain-containing protein [Adhaeretor mobilis]|uniref:Thiol-disulfide oxidoreductase ResA n=1 Tax=Adhaeretor mobilis TaxID=1930276 RepID=A0A517MSP4_9BACT|nr:redoxin domain-containing protein [Adhaeretor mobilis]QDS97905.1 Thiol-disulfide oxidoreductase ResA [Adhaeretor mobilis]